MQNMTIEHWPIDKLIPYGNNPRKNDEHVEKFAEAIKVHGFRVPILAKSNGDVIDGHFRLKAAKVAGLETVPVIPADDMTDEQIRSFRIFVNAMADLAEWDLDLLKDELEALKDLDIDLDLTGLDVDFMDGLLNQIDETEGLTDPDDIPDLPKEPITKKGDLYQLGRHRLLCGDSTVITDVECLMADKKADMVFTDPPYNVNYEGKAGKIQNDNMKDEKFYQFLFDIFTNYFMVLVDGGGIYVAHADTEGLNFRRAFKEAGFKLASCLIWRKNSLVLGRADYHWQHEPILYGWKPTGSHKFYGGRNKTTMQEFLSEDIFTQSGDNEYQFTLGDSTFVIIGTDIQVHEVLSTIILEEKPKASKLHPTMKPITLITRFLSNSSKNGQLILDLFLGSGSTLIACEQMGRVCYGIELDPKYCDVIIKRWEDFTGLKAELING